MDALEQHVQIKEIKKHMGDGKRQGKRREEMDKIINSRIETEQLAAR